MIILGPYRFSRNPQYVGVIMFLLGTVILYNSFYAFVTGFIGIVWFLITPFIEESWLKEQFKEEYDEYTKKVPRFI